MTRPDDEQELSPVRRIRLASEAPVDAIRTEAVDVSISEHSDESVASSTSHSSDPRTHRSKRGGLRHRIKEVIQDVKKRYQKVPPRYKYICFFLWVAWKVVAALCVVYLVQQSSPRLRLLYLVTIPTQSTTLITTWMDSVRTLAAVHDVHVVLIVGNQTWDNSETLRHRWPPGVARVTAWTDATPYDVTMDGRLVPSPTQLMLQHRYVVKDYLLSNYDLLLAWEADAYVTPTHVDYAWRHKGTAALPAWIPVVRRLSPTNQTTLGPFAARACCATDGPHGVLLSPNETATLEQLPSETIRAPRASSPVWLSATARPMGWIMTPAQVAQHLQSCPHFLPTAKERPETCPWHRWIDLDARQFSHHFVEYSSLSPISASLVSVSPNQLWNEWKVGHTTFTSVQ